MKDFYEKLFTVPQQESQTYWASLRSLTTADLQTLAKVKPAPSWTTWW